MNEPNSADYERGWQDAIASLNPPGTAERARLNEAATGLVRRFAGAMQHYATDMDRVARAMEALDVEPDEARRVEDGAWHSIWLHGSWRDLTTKMTTEQREAAARAVERHWDVMYAPSGDRMGASTQAALRWWEQ